MGMSLKSYFRSSGYTRESLIQTEAGEFIELSALSPFLRTLLIMDGTVTKSLSAWFWEPITVEPQLNKLDVASAPIVGLEDLQDGDTVLHRDVILRGSHTRHLFACARSVVSLKHLPKNISDALKKGEMGIGELLRENDVETYRDIFEINYYLSSSEDDELLCQLSGEIISRSYRIRVKGVPAIIVTEYFPIDLYR